MSSQSLKQKAAKGLFWGGISNGLQQLLGVLIGIILLKNLSPSDYGMIGLLAIFTGIGNTLLESGFTATLTNRPEFKDKDYNSVFWFNIGISILIYILLYFSAPLIEKFYAQPGITILARILFLAFISSSLGIAHNAVLFRKLMVKERAKIEISAMLLSGAIGIYMALRGYGYWALAFQTLTYSTTGTLLRWYFSPWRPSFQFNIQPIKEMFGLSSTLLISNIVHQIQNNIFSVLLGKYYTKIDVGYYSQGVKWSGMGVLVISGMINGIAQPILLEVKDDKLKQVSIFRKLIRFIAFICFPCLLGLALIGRDFILLINAEWEPCIPILQLYCIWGAFSPMLVLYNQIAIIYSRSKFYFGITMIYAFIQIIAPFLMLSYGMYWMAFIIVAISFLFLCIWHLYIQTIIPLKTISIFKDIFPYLIITLIILAISYFTTSKIEIIWLRLSSRIIIAILLYIFCMWKTNSVIFKEIIAFVTEKK